MQTNNLKSSLQHLKKEIEKSEQNVKRHKDLSETRELTFNKIEFLKKHLREKILQTHQLLKINPQKTEELKLHIEHDQKQIITLTQELVLMDHELEQIEEDPEKRLKGLQQQLICDIKKHNCQAATEYHHLNDCLTKARVYKQQLIFQKEQLFPLIAELEQGAMLPQGWKYFFRNPQAQLARTIQNAILFAEKSLPYIIHPPIKAFIDNFLFEAKKPVNRELYAKGLKIYFDQISSFFMKIENEGQKLEEEVKLLEAQLQKWIESYS